VTDSAGWRVGRVTFPARARVGRVTVVGNFFRLLSRRTTHDQGTFRQAILTGSRLAKICIKGI
jgi:hypothetical protein